MRKTIGDTLVARDESPHATAARHQRDRLLAHARRRLSGRQTALLTMRYEDGQTFVEIGRQLQVSEVAAFRMHGRALRILLAEFAGAGVVALRQIL